MALRLNSPQRGSRPASSFRMVVLLLVSFLVGLVGLYTLHFVRLGVKDGAKETQQHNVASHLLSITSSLSSVPRATLRRNELEERRDDDKITEPVPHQIVEEPKLEERRDEDKMTEPVPHQIVEEPKPNVVYSSRGILNDGDGRHENTTDEIIAADERRLERFSKAILQGGNHLKKLTFQEARSKINASSGSEEMHTAIMYAPDIQQCVVAKEKMKRDSAHKGALDLFLQKCLDKKASRFMFDVCFVVKEYFSSADPKWRTRHEAGKDVGGQRRNFIEVGGLDGSYINSMTFVFEMLMHELWTGLTIEATPANFVGLKKNRPCTYRTEIALGSRWGSQTFFGWGGCCSGISSGMPATFVKHFHGQKPDSYPVMTAPFSDVVAAAGMLAIDFMSLDVEGAEYFVVQGMDSKVPVSMLLVEATQWKNAERNLTRLLIERGYSQDTSFESYNNMNQLWVHLGHAEPFMRDIFRRRQHTEANEMKSATI